MSTLSTDQGLILPATSDGDNVPLSFSDFSAGLSDDGVESRLVKRYLSAADRTVRNPAPNTGEVCYRIDGAVYEYYTGSAWETLAVPGAWTTFAATWTASGGGAAIGNGSVDTRYRKVGKTVEYTGRILMGSTTTFGTGTYNVDLPFVLESADRYIGAAYLHDASSGSGQMSAICRSNGTSLLRFQHPTGGVSNSSPFTWANTDQIVWSITYQTT